MKKVLMVLVMITSMNNAFGATNDSTPMLGEDASLQECKESVQTASRQDEFDIVIEDSAKARAAAANV